MYAISSSFMQTTPDDYKTIMHNGFLAMDEELRSKQSENDNDRSGSTAITAFVTPDHIIVANCGISFIIFYLLILQVIQDVFSLVVVQQFH